MRLINGVNENQNQSEPICLFKDTVAYQEEGEKNTFAISKQASVGLLLSVCVVDKLLVVLNTFTCSRRKKKKNSGSSFSSIAA